MLFAEQLSQTNGFAPRYESPTDQTAAETLLIEEYGRRFANPRLPEIALGHLKEVTGNDQPEFIARSEVTVEAKRTEDENNPPSAKMVLKEPVNLSRWKLAKTIMSRRKHYKALVAAYADESTIVGEMDEETHALLEGVYKLVGAQVIRNDVIAREKTGFVIRRGHYHGQAVYFQEIYNNEDTALGGRKTLEVNILSREAAMIAMEEHPGQAQARVADRIGITAGERQSKGATGKARQTDLYRNIGAVVKMLNDRRHRQ